jgi:heat shock protein HslJ
MSRTWIVLAMAVVGLGVVGSASPQSSRSSELTANIWVLAGLDGKAPLAGTSVTAEFASGGVSGSGGCNRYSGKARTLGRTIRISSLVTTEMACQPKIMTQESAYLKALTSARRYSIDGGSLTLKALGGRVLATFKAQSQQLAGTSWTVVSYNNGKQAVESVLAATKLTAVFGKDGNLTGFAGCNSYSAAYSGTPPKLTIAQVSSTRKYCATPTGAMDQEAQYLAALATAATYRIEGTTLELRTASGDLAAEFRRK